MMLTLLAVLLVVIAVAGFAAGVSWMLTGSVFGMVIGSQTITAALNLFEIVVRIATGAAND